MDLIDHLRTLLAQHELGMAGTRDVEARLWDLLLTRADEQAARERAIAAIPPLPLPPAPAWWHELAHAADV